MSKLFLYYILFRLTGNPILAILVLLVVIYFAVRRFLGLFPKRSLRTGATLLGRGAPRGGRLARFALRPRLCLRRAEADGAVSAQNKELALDYLQTFKQVNSSSVRAYYRQGTIYRQLGQLAEAKAAFAEALEIYRTLPSYLKKTERRWALLSWFKR